jgi:hypothetical protein
MIPTSCGLDADGLSAQLARYRAVGHAAEIVERSPGRLVLSVGDQIADTTIADLIAVENDCCPFFELMWQSGQRRLAIGVADPAHEPDLALIATALVADG